MTFYYPNGKIIKEKDGKTAQEVFVEYYMPYYFRDKTTDTKNGSVKGITRNHKAIEDIADTILKDGLFSEKHDFIWDKYIFKLDDGTTLKDIGLQHKEQELLFVLAWKMGKISHTKTTSKEIIFQSSCKNDSKLGVVINSGSTSICLKTAYEEIQKYLNGNDFSNNSRNLMNKVPTIKGIGAVYWISLLFFITKGEYPIYDRFAERALDAIIHDENHKDGLHTFWTATANAYCGQSYLEMLDTVFNEQWRLSHFADNYEKWKYARDIDRSLWVYGHLFNQR